MVASVATVDLQGIEAHRVTVEANVGGGLPVFRLVGLPDASVREAGDRVRSAIERSSFTWKQERVVVNLAPGRLQKAGTGFDLPVALAVLAATDQLPPEVLRDVVALGELGLDGTLRGVPGVLPAAAAARRLGFARVVVPLACAPEAALVDGIEVVAASDLRDAVEVLTGDRPRREVVAPPCRDEVAGPDLADVRGQWIARRAMEVAAAGGHHVLLVGPPGCGKSMLAQRLPGLLPPLTVDQALEVASIESVAGLRRPDAELSMRPPFRAPHHGTSLAGLIGGGSGRPRPGEVSLAHQGVLFVDELLEAPRHVLDSLRQPIESGQVVLTRARGTVRYPATFQFVAATNPCPCGHDGSARRACRCRPDQVARYQQRLSGPLLDRLDLVVTLRPVDRRSLIGPSDGEPTAAVAQRVAQARVLALARFGAPNRRANPQQLRSTATGAALCSVLAAAGALDLTARSLDAVLRVARTVADLAGAELVEAAHVDEAVALRAPALAAAA